MTENMSNHKTRGIVLKYNNLRSADRLLTVFTYDFGKILAVVRGAKKDVSKLMGHLDVFNFSDLMLAQGRTFDTVAGCDSIENFPRIRRDIKLSALAYCFLEIIDKFIVDQQKDEKMFLLCLGFLRQIEINCFSMYKLYHSFLLRIIELSGFGVEIEKYLECQKELNILLKGQVKDLKILFFDKNLERKISDIENIILANCEIQNIKSKEFLDNLNQLTNNLSC